MVCWKNCFPAHTRGILFSSCFPFAVSTVVQQKLRKLFPDRDDGVSSAALCDINLRVKCWTKDLQNPAPQWELAGIKIIQIKVKILSLQEEFLITRREGKSFEREISLFQFPLARIIHALIYGWNWKARQHRVPSEFRRKNLWPKFPFSINSICPKRSTRGALTMITNVWDWELKIIHANSSTNLICSWI